MSSPRPPEKKKCRLKPKTTPRTPHSKRQHVTSSPNCESPSIGHVEKRNNLNKSPIYHITDDGKNEDITSIVDINLETPLYDSKNNGQIDPTLRPDKSTIEKTKDGIELLRLKNPKNKNVKSESIPRRMRGSYEFIDDYSRRIKSFSNQKIKIMNLMDKLSSNTKGVVGAVFLSEAGNITWHTTTSYDPRTFF